ncbi:MAG: hypothetical protein D5R97_02105 [Candidatus Syntrophonatronum acetioxidans]|uniref:Uncharacterized protein n=1 Tax=Candidatus Syntrophonatronum acetioxidans TaxID=1795816 RepID=A0A424YHE8_9FIRM|nr:MAG: hypothetical protein D5R97_02105 [Candidatus Syntrophonatronum acetioxidans]
MENKVEQFPRPAGPNINEALDNFLEDQGKRLASSTLNQYAVITEFLRECLNSCGYQFLDEEEYTLWKKLSDKRKRKREFSQIFGPDKIPEIIDDFLSYFMLKLFCGKSMIKVSGRVTKRLGLWLKEKKYISNEESFMMVEMGELAVRELPLAKEFEEKLFSLVEKKPLIQEEEKIEDVFLIKEVEGNRVYLTATEVNRGTIAIDLSAELTRLCKPGWLVYLHVSRTSQGWSISMTGGVDPCLGGRI